MHCGNRWSNCRADGSECAASPTHTPHGRGYNTSLNYYGHGNYMWTEIEWGGSKGAGAGTVPTQGTIDLWDTDKVWRFRYT